MDTPTPMNYEESDCFIVDVKNEIIEEEDECLIVQCTLVDVIAEKQLQEIKQIELSDEVEVEVYKPKRCWQNQYEPAFEPKSEFKGMTKIFSRKP